MKKTAAILLAICLIFVIAAVKIVGGTKTDIQQEESYVYVGGDLRGNHAGRLFSPHEIEGIEDGFVVSQCVNYGDQLAIAATKRSQEEALCLFYVVDQEKETVTKLTELTAAELYHIDGDEDGQLFAFVKTDKNSAGSLLRLSADGIHSEIALGDFPRAAALKPTQVWKLENKYLLVCAEGLFIFDPKNGEPECIFGNQERIYGIFRNQDGALLFYTGSSEPFSTQAETCLYRLNEELVPELVVKKDALAAFWPGTNGFCLMSSEERENQLYQLNLETGEESSFAYTGNMPMTGDYFYVSEDCLLFWRPDLPLGMARPAMPGEYQLLNIAGWIPEASSTSSYQEYYKAREGLLPQVIHFAILSGKEYIPCYTLYEGESGLKELKAALAEGFMPDILDTTWLPPGTGAEYLMDLRPLLSDTVLETGLALGREEPGALYEFTPALIPSAAYLDGPLWESVYAENQDAALMSREKFLRLSAPLIYTLLIDDGKTEEVAAMIAYASSLPENAENTEYCSAAALPLQEHGLLLCGPVSFEVVLNKTMQICADNMDFDEVQAEVLPAFKLGIVSQASEEKLAACIDFLEFCLTQKECVFMYDQAGVSLYRGTENSEQYEESSEDLIRKNIAAHCRELYFDPSFFQKLEQIVEDCAVENMTPEFGAKQLREHAA